MNRSVLAGLLIVQIVLVAIVWGTGGSGGEEPEAFLAFDAESIDKLVVADADNSAELTRSAEGWTLADGLPADGDKVDEVIGKLAAASGGWPVATSESAAQRFEVTEEKFQRHIVASAGDDIVADVYLGTSPSFRKVHARHADGGPVYGIGFSNYEAGAEPSDWLDKALLRPDGEVSAIEKAGAFKLLKSEDGWTAVGANLDNAEVDTFVGRFTGLNVVDLSEADLPDEPKMAFVIDDAKGSQRLAIYHLTEEDDYIATSDRIQGRFEISKYIAEQMDVALEDMEVEPPEDTDTEEAPAPAES